VYICIHIGRRDHRRHQVWMYICMFVYIFIHIYIYICTYIYIYRFMCVCVYIYIYTHWARRSSMIPGVQGVRIYIRYHAVESIRLSGTLYAYSIRTLLSYTRCVGCENPHTIPCSRIHQIVWHPIHTFFTHIIIVTPIFVIQMCRV